METYRGVVVKADFPGPGDATGVTATVTYWGTTGAEVTEPIALDQTNAATLLYEHVYQSDLVTVKWSWEDFELQQRIEVVNPILDMDELSDALNETDQAVLSRLERRARHKIEAVTQQSFNRYRATKTLYGRNNSALELPARLISVDTITSGTTGLLVSNFKVDGDGWYLQPFTSFSLPDEDYYTNTIGFPWYKPFSDQQSYSVSGVWGWEDVPEPVKEAGLIVAEGYACTDDKFRDRYVSSLNISPVVLSFNPKAFQGTGSQDADLLLGQYVNTQIMAI